MNWKCPKCGRKFRKEGQLHSCRVFPLEKHFANKDYALKLFGELKKALRKKIGSFEVVSLPCCIHLHAKGVDFMAAYALRDGLKLHFALERKLSSPRIGQAAQYSAHRVMHEMKIETADEIDAELLDWLKQATKTR
ncbi:hypothetical protein H0O03_04710 [Candidatus Micrarchaeota archaeon]|nr:hypothetical protein [Candidatus Micrarchaeota archaeon]